MDVDFFLFDISTVGAADAAFNSNVHHRRILLPTRTIHEALSVTGDAHCAGFVMQAVPWTKEAAGDNWIPHHQKDLDGERIALPPGLNESLSNSSCLTGETWAP
eukprot:gene8412-9271_t